MIKSRVIGVVVAALVAAGGVGTVEAVASPTVASASAHHHKKHHKHYHLKHKRCPKHSHRVTFEDKSSACIGHNKHGWYRLDHTGVQRDGHGHWVRIDAHGKRHAVK